MFNKYFQSLFFGLFYAYLQMYLFYSKQMVESPNDVCVREGKLPKKYIGISECRFCRLILL